jgi:ABC-type transporter Mla MlaB component
VPSTPENPVADDELQSLDFTVPGAFCPVPADHPASPAPQPAAAPKPLAASLAGTLSARVEQPLKQVLKACGHNPVRLDVSRIAAADDQGCALLLAALDACRDAHGNCALVGADHLAALLAARIKSGERHERHVWLLLLDLCQRLGRERAFRDAAKAYAVSFGITPPSWDASRVGGCE